MAMVGRAAVRTSQHASPARPTLHAHFWEGLKHADFTAHLVNHVVALQGVKKLDERHAAGDSKGSGGDVAHGRGFKRRQRLWQCWRRLQTLLLSPPRPCCVLLLMPRPALLREA